MWRESEAELQRSNAMDFDDLLAFAVRLLAEYPHRLTWLRQRWRWIPVDEYQDTSHAQATLVELLAGLDGNLCVVGDDDQLIHGWRQADPRHILGFAERHPGRTEVVLGRNFRSRAEILQAAASCVHHNEHRAPKALIAMRGNGGQVRVVGLGNEYQEAHWMAGQIADALGAGTPPAEILALARTAYATEPLQHALARHGIPHWVLGSLGLYERTEVRDALAYLTLLQNPRDAQALRRAIASPRRGVGPATLTRLITGARDRHGGDLIAAAGHAAELDRMPSEAARQRLVEFGVGLSHCSAENNSSALREGQQTGLMPELSRLVPRENAGADGLRLAILGKASDGGRRRVGRNGPGPGINPQSSAVGRAVGECVGPWLRAPKTNVNMLAIPEVLVRALRIIGRLVAWCAGAAVPLLVAGCGGGSPGVARSGSSSTATVTISAAEQYQRIAGFGVSEGFGQAETLMRAPASVQQRVLSLLYSPTRGAGLTILRNEISADAGFTIEPKAPSHPTAKPSYLSLAEVDEDQGQLWFAKQIKADYGASVFADAWSAPAFMKTNGSAINGGTVCGVSGARCRSGDWRQAYADYLVQYAKDYAAAGVPLSYVGAENEGNLSVAQDSMIMSPAQTANFMQVLGATLARSGLSTRAECCATESWNYAQQYATAIESDKQANTATALFTSHGYFAAPGSPLRGWSKPVWQTEWAPFGHQPWDPAWDDGSLSSGFTWAQNIHTGLTASNLGAFLYLWGANTSTTAMTGPNTGLVEVNGNTVATSGRLWAFASYSRFIRPGAVRIGTTTSRAGLEVSAFRNSDGSIAVIVLNSAHSRQAATFSLRGLDAAHVTPYLTDTSHALSAQTPLTVRNSTFTATLPPRSLVSYDIKS